MNIENPGLTRPEFWKQPAPDRNMSLEIAALDLIRDTASDNITHYGDAFD